MAVYTKVSERDLAAFLANYALPSEASLSEIADGVENSNFLLRAGSARYILTIFEKRVDPADLPWFFALMTHLRDHAIACPSPLPDRDGRVLNAIYGKAAVITSFLDGRPALLMSEKTCFEAGRSLARIHVAGETFLSPRANRMGADAWVALSDACLAAASATKISDEDASMVLLARELRAIVPQIVSAWPESRVLPSGPIHADFFPDNVFFSDDAVSGVIDFYFAANDFLAYDLAIALNAWCFPTSALDNSTLCRAMLDGYQSGRRLASAEKASLPLLARGAALRFTLTRLYDWLRTPEDALVTRKDPFAFKRLYDIWTHDPPEVF